MRNEPVALDSLDQSCGENSYDPSDGEYSSTALRNPSLPPGPERAGKLLAGPRAVNQACA